MRDQPRHGARLPDVPAFLTRGAAFALIAGVVLTASGAGCDTEPTLKCPPADPPMTAQYSDATTLVVDVSSSANTGPIVFNLIDPASVTGGRLSFQDASKSLKLTIVTDATAKDVTAHVNATCTDGVIGDFTIDAQIPATHQAGDYIPVVVRNY